MKKKTISLTSYLANALYLVIYDIHLGHRKNPTKDIIAGLDHYFKKYEDLFSTIKVMFFTGDVFDRLLHLSSEDVLLSAMWINRIISFCAENDIAIRVLEGTPLHDRGQSSLFEMLSVDKDVDVKYINSIHIEHIKSLDMNVLYIPDEWAESAEVLESEVLNLLAANNLEYVDIAMMHGLFDYQLPSHIPNLLRLSENFFNDIVKHLIHIGHIHTYNPRGKIIPGGSVDRLAHNEEEDKGIILVSNEGGKLVPEFLVNEKAKVFKTIDITGASSVQDIKDTLKDELKGIGDGSHIRLYSKEASSFIENISDLKKIYPMLHFTKKNDINKTVTTYDAVDMSDAPVINKHTIIDVFTDYVKDKDFTTDVSTMSNIIKFHLEDIK